MMRFHWKSPMRNEESAISMRYINNHPRIKAMKPKTAAVLALMLALVSPAWSAVRWSDCLRQAAEWYGTPEAIALADNVLHYQTVHGGWPKNMDMAHPPSEADVAKYRDPDSREATIDNGATTTHLKFLARVISSNRGTDPHRAAFTRGLDYLLEAQYKNGGWPQFFPLKKGYHTRITFNDGAMISVLVFLDEIAKGSESVGIVRFLMSIEKPSPEIIAAVEGAVQWFGAVGIRGLRIDASPGGDGKPERRAVSDAEAPVLWARFYELETNRPIFMGRDKVIRYDFNEIERERRTGYAYLGTWPAALIGKEYPQWKKRN